MKTVNSISGGKTSAYIAAHYTADDDVCALVRNEHEASKCPNKKVRQLGEEKIQDTCIATAEEDEII